jgi:hypothetical protein
MDLEANLIQAGWDVVACVPTVHEALDAIADRQPEAVILDLTCRAVPAIARRRK